MHRKRENLDILFRMTSPEIILASIHSMASSNHMKDWIALPYHYSQAVYEHFAPWNFREYSPDEIEEQYNTLRYLLKVEGKSQSTLPGKIGKLHPQGGIFTAIYQYAEIVLCLEGREPVCRQEQLLNFNSISKRLGQDIFVTCWLAGNDHIQGFWGDWNFTWPAALRTDDVRLRQMLEKGIAENHFHLNGSTQNLALSWACLMNHPKLIPVFLREDYRFRENLGMRMSRGEMDNAMNWTERLRYAAVIRALLCMHILGISDSQMVYEEFRKYEDVPYGMDLGGKVEILRKTYGAKVVQSNKKIKCLDYAMSENMYFVDLDNHNRLLAGERSFLYHCFRMQFRGELSELESAIFYLYLSIKSNFRGELVQNNGRPGFKNFADYQDRKSQCFDKVPEYNEEAYRLAVAMPLKAERMKSLEARIMPGKSVRLMRGEIARIDKAVVHAVDGNENLPYFFVIHFPKTKFTIKDYERYPVLLRTRNYKTRNMAYQRARVLGCYLEEVENARFRKESDRQRICGIDACSREIGCRPETFATEFRYLQSCSSNIVRQFDYQRHEKKYIDLGITYHVGEDFLDIVDGLRAIDETMQFLQLRKGSRLGHALALGTETEAYYCMKRHNICLPRQDILDNLIWMLYRSLELDVTIEASQRELLRNKAQELLVEIYHGSANDTGEKNDMYPSESLDSYYYSWKLRGDHPSLYVSGGYREEEKRLYNVLYTESKVTPGNLDVYRKMTVVTRYLYKYHFDENVRTNGAVSDFLDLYEWPWYGSVVAELQRKIRLEIAKKGIAIECNPTSNVLIGTFGSYNRHPLLTFNRCRLEDERMEPNLVVSINTDDLGVFDTSLENEYALMLCAILQERHYKNNYNDDAVYDYIDHIRENGLRMTFRPMN